MPHWRGACPSKPPKKNSLIQHTDERGAVDLRYVYIDLTPSSLI